MKIIDFRGGGANLGDNMARKKRHIGKRHVIGLVVDTAFKPRRDVMLGWLRYVRDRDDIDARFFFSSLATSVENVLEFANSGVHAIVLCGLQRDTIIGIITAVKSGMLKIPVVVLSTYLPLLEEYMHYLLPQIGAVLMDHEAIGRCVGGFFLEHGLDSFGFLMLNLNYERDAGRIRCNAFRTAVMADNDERKVFNEKIFGVCKPNGDCWDGTYEELVSWVKTLPLPCGVFASGDRSARLLLDICKSLGIDVPGQIEVVGVNNSTELCEGIVPTISSVQPDFDRCAQLSIDMALDLAVGKRLSEEERIVKVSSCAIVERGSSLSGRSYGKIVTRARDFIRENACTGISVTDVAKYLGISRRTLEVRVKYATGNSVLKLIRKVRLENICHLLETTDLSMAEVVMRSGYNLTGNAGVVFKKVYGMTMNQYRLSHSGKAQPAAKVT